MDTETTGTYTFTTSNPSFLTRDNNGSFSAQVTYNASRPVAFGFVIAEHLDALAAGPVTANVDEFVTIHNLLAVISVKSSLSITAGTGPAHLM